MRFGVLLLLVLLRPCAASAQAKPLQGFDAYVTRSMAAWQVPGLAVAIVRNDSVVLAKGYGVRTLGKPAPVDTHTLFAIGSASKAFTAMAVNALLADPMAKRVRASTGSGFPSVRTPYPLASTTESFRTMATASPGTCHAAMLRVT